MTKIVQYIPIVFLLIVYSLFFRHFFLEGKLPIPADTIVGLYHPYRDLYASEYPNGMPYKNFLITDPVRQQYPWRNLAVTQLKEGKIPVWNPYSMAGTPHFANIQSATFYPLNMLFFFLPFSFAWSLLIFLQPVLAGLFTFFYLRNLRLHIVSALIGALSFSLSGFFVAWMEWGTVLHVALWLPLLLLGTDKIFGYAEDQKNTKISLKNRKLLLWGGIYIFSLTAAFLAGHLQTFFYLILVSIAYFLARLKDNENKKALLLSFFVLFFIFACVTFVQWTQTFQLIMESARTIDQADWQKSGWFLPWHHLIQFVAPDFFGNPATLNYWGVWNYAELVGYVGIVPLIFSLFGLLVRKDKKTFFFGTVFFLSLIFSLPTFFAKIPFIADIPFLATSQPTRLIFLTTFSLSVLAALGIDYFFRRKEKIYISFVILGIIFMILWLVIFVPFFQIFGMTPEQVAVAKRNMIVPTVLFVLAIFGIGISFFLKSKKIMQIVVIGLILLTSFDLLRFADKFTPFTDGKYLFPESKTTMFLKENVGNSRIMSIDSRILPPNFSVMYKIPSVEGYDPLYLQRFGELMYASEAQSPIYPQQLGFNRIITPHRYDSRIIDLLGVKYILSLQSLEAANLRLVSEEGQTKVYENKGVLPRAFFVEEVIPASGKEAVLKKMIDTNTDFLKTAVVEDALLQSTHFSQGTVEIIEYTENKVTIKTTNSDKGFLILTDTYYPVWKARVLSEDGKTSETSIYRTDYHFRGVIVPEGENIVEFYTSIF